MKYGIHWFRRDLRVAGNQALLRQLGQNKGKVLGIFFFDDDFLSRKDFSHNRFQLFLHTLKELKKELQELGGDLLVYNSVPEKGFPEIFKKIKANGHLGPELITWNRDYEPFARKRDQKVFDFLTKEGIKVENYRDHLIVEPHELVKDKNGEGYKVYSPFAKKWLLLFESDDFQKRILKEKNGLKYLENRLQNKKQEKLFDFTWNRLIKKSEIKDSLNDFIKENLTKVDIPIPKAGSLEAYQSLKMFAKKVDSYGEKRDFPYLLGTSNLSMFLKNGSITTSQIIYYLKLKSYSKKITGKEVYLSELIWREFYYHILFRYPDVEKKEFVVKYQNIKWKRNSTFLECWKNGTTGFPIVDAGMRQLKKTGQIHNRVRMIVASFLCKDLLINWREGEKHFMEKLLDGDLAPNNGGWQWAASTGCDAQPYFRIFNPWLQSKKFDKEGNYIKKYIPELRDIESKNLHAPILGHKSYPEPIVDHKRQRELALALYSVKS